MQSEFRLFGVRPDLVFQALINKNQATTSAQTHTKLGLIIEGGGMRGIIASGSLVALHLLGYARSFDIIYGTSAGALSGAFFISEQVPYGISLYYEELAGSKFVNPFRVPRFFDIDYLIDAVRHKKKLDTTAVKNSPTQLLISTTEISSGSHRYFSNKENIDIIDAIKASCALPICYDKPVQIDGGHYLDGGTVGSLPIERAIESGCTDILVLLTKPKTRENLSNYSSLPTWFEGLRVKKYGKNFTESFLARRRNYENAMRKIEGQETIKANVNIAAIAPMNQDITIATTNALQLKKAYLKSYHYTLELFKNFQNQQKNGNSCRFPF